ncbi:hypothetical protein A9Q99_17425 [Gammaproteobacteria bacterium 45_16_T64]|nr:hypothetical protein A9Q99_17425 [Gammaproteobacteria bacterium 45_16_T64]
MCINTYLRIAVCTILLAGCQQMPLNTHSDVNTAGASSKLVVDSIYQFDIDNWRHMDALLGQIVEKIEMQHVHPVDFNRELTEQWILQLIEDMDGRKWLFTQGEADAIYNEYRTIDIKNDLPLSVLNAVLDQLTEKKRSTYLELITYLSTEIDLHREGFFRFPEQRFLTESSRMAAMKGKVTADLVRRVSLGEPETKARSILKTMYQYQLKKLDEHRVKDRATVLITALLKVIDERIAYFPPHDGFNIGMSLKLVGIGAVLQREHEDIKIVRPVKGGPAERAGIKANDIILEIAEGSGEFKIVTGMSLDDVVRRIRGPEDSLVRLKIKRGSAYFDQDVIRGQVKLQDRAVSYHVEEIDTPVGRRNIAVIKVPTFYSDFQAIQRGDRNARSTRNDVAKVIRLLETKQVAGVILDLRGNGGGSLQQASEVSGLFIGSGNFVQFKSSSGYIDSSRYEGVALYLKPLVVLTNQLTAGTAEIVAAAVKDYNRGVLVGYPTYGMGSVQVLQRLKKGNLKLTAAEYFRVTGENFVKNGLVPDIHFQFCGVNNGVRSEKTAKDISATRYRAMDANWDLVQLRKRHNNRIKQNVDIREMRQKDVVSKKQEEALPLGLGKFKNIPIEKRAGNGHACADVEEGEAIAILRDMIYR